MTYPSPRDALFGNGHTANLYCAVKWMLWHLFHLLFIIAAVPFAIAWVVTLVVAAAVKQTAFWLMPKGAFEENRLVRSFQASAKNTPVARRVYNECPVDMKMDPKWFRKVEDAVFGLVDTVIEWGKR